MPTEPPAQHRLGYLRHKAKGQNTEPHSLLGLSWALVRPIY